MVRRVARHGEALICCRESFRLVRSKRLDPNLMNRCKPEKMDPKEYGTFLKTNFSTRRGKGSRQECEEMDN